MEMTCILCPMGCRMQVEETDGHVKVSGNTCARGLKYGEQELKNPMRVVTSSIRLTEGQHALCPVKTAGQVKKAAITAVLAAIKSARVQPPVRVGQVLISDVAGTGVDVVATGKRQ